MEQVKKEKKVKKLGRKKTHNTKKKEITDLNGNTIKSEEIKKISKKEKFTMHVKKYKRIYRLVLILLFAIAVVFFGYIGIRNYILSKKYGKYEKRMNNYGFSLM